MCAVSRGVLAPGAFGASVSFLDETRIIEIRNKTGDILMLVPEHFEGTDVFVGACLDFADAGWIDMGGTNASNCSLVSANLYHAFLNATNLTGANLQGADLRGADLENANLSFADLRNAMLGRSNIGVVTRVDGANLTGANLEGTDIEGATYDSLTIFPDGVNPRERGMITHEDFGDMQRDLTAPSA